MVGSPIGVRATYQGWRPVRGRTNAGNCGSRGGRQPRGARRRTIANVLLCVFAEAVFSDGGDASHRWRPSAMDERGAAAGFGPRPQCSHSIAANSRRLAGCHAPAAALCDAAAWTFRRTRDAAGGGGDLWRAELLGERAAERNCDSVGGGGATFRDSWLGGAARYAAGRAGDCAWRDRSLGRVQLAEEYGLRCDRTQPADDAGGGSSGDHHCGAGGERAALACYAYRRCSKPARGLMSLDGRRGTACRASTQDG